jgi:hypothetical protein
VRPTTWIQNTDPSKCRGLFNSGGTPIAAHTILTTYSGPIVDQTTHTGAPHYLATVMRGTFAINGYRFPKSGHGLAQFANDYHGSGRTTPNARLVPCRQRGLELELLLVSMCLIRPEDEICISIPGHVAALVDTQASYSLNRLRSLAIGTLCVVRSDKEPWVCRILQDLGEGDVLRVHWSACTDDNEDWTISDLIGGSFDRGWERDDHITFSRDCPMGGYRAYTTDEVITTRNILVHNVVLTDDNHLQADLQAYLRHKFSLASFRMMS